VVIEEASMARFARVVLGGAPSDDELDPMTIDLALNEDGFVAQRFLTSGWWGGIKSDEFLPFVIDATGKMDFGTGFEEADRYATTNLPTKRIEVGEYVTVFDEYGEHCFVVKQLLWMDELPVQA
jgi:hypothetical protein